MGGAVKLQAQHNADGSTAAGGASSAGAAASGSSAAAAAAAQNRACGSRGGPGLLLLLDIGDTDLGGATQRGGGLSAASAW